jgi:hypothetical protein
VTDPIAKALDLFVPAFSSVEGNWQEIIDSAPVAKGMPGLSRPSIRWPSAPRHRLLAAVVIVVLTLVLPALALSGVLDTLFGFSNQGTPVPNPSLDMVQALQATSAQPGSFVKLGSSQGITVYAAKREGGQKLCFYAGEDGSNANIGGDCLAPGKFPSQSLPVWDKDMTAGYANVPGLPAQDFAIRFLVGVAADAVASIQVLAGPDCHPVATVPVINNVYIDVLKPIANEDYIVAREASGKAVWHQGVNGGPQVPTCGLH